MWQGEHDILIDAPAASVWAIWTDVAGWTKWNAGIESIALHGPFTCGTTFTMKPPGQEALESKLVMVDPSRGFTDETKVDDVVVVVEHLLRPEGRNQVRVVYRTSVHAPNAAEIGAMVTSDFPEVLGALRALTERGQAIPPAGPVIA